MTPTHRIPDPPPILDAMTSGASGASSLDLLNNIVVTAYDIPDSDRNETLLLLDNNRVILLSCDPRYDDEGVQRVATEWEVVMYDATDTPAGKAMKRLDEGQWS